MDKELLTTEEAAQFLALSPGTLRKWRMGSVSKRIGLPFVRLGRAIRYKRSDLLLFIERGGGGDDRND